MTESPRGERVPRSAMRRTQRARAALEVRQRACDPRNRVREIVAGELSGYWRFRVGDYRLVCRIDDGKLTVLVVSLGHRKLVYRQ